MSDLISRQAVVDMIDSFNVFESRYDQIKLELMIRELPSAQPETATVTIGRTKGSITIWYECDACGEPVDQKDSYCRNCGRKLKHE